MSLRMSEPNMHIRIDVYKPSGKWYTGQDVYHDTNIPLHDPSFARFIADHLPAHYDGGFVVVTDCEDGVGFHNSLHLYDSLPKTAKFNGEDGSEEVGWRMT